LKRKNQPVVNRLKCKAWKTQLNKTSQVKEEKKKLQLYTLDADDKKQKEI